DAQVGAVDVAGQWTHEVGHQVGDVGGAAEPAGRVVQHLPQDPGFDVGPGVAPAAFGRDLAVEGFDAGGHHDAGADGVDAYAGARELFGQRDGQVDQGRLGSGVLGHGRERHGCLPAGHLHDAAPAAFPHAWHERPDEPYRGDYVALVPAQPVLGGGVLPRGVRVPAGVVDEDIDAVGE